MIRATIRMLLKLNLGVFGSKLLPLEIQLSFKDSDFLNQTPAFNLPLEVPASILLMSTGKREDKRQDIRGQY